MTPIAQAIEQIRATLPAGVRLVAVSKFHPVEALRQAYDAGQRLFGESRVQELQAKIPQMPEDVQWHFIGHLQTNKVRALINAGPIALIESVDSERLLRLIDAEAVRAGITVRVLMQLHVAREETKFGFTPDELLQFFTAGGYTTLQATHICGLMGMASNTDDTERIRRDFATIAATATAIRSACPDLRGFDTISMGMSDDYPIAIEEGATLVRVGTAIFGAR